MTEITPKEFLIRQPSFPETKETDPIYLQVANRLLKKAAACDFAGSLPEGLVKRIVLTLVDYLQDIVADAGLWRSFVDANRELYGFSVPFHSVGEDYIDYELNREDVRFLVWYAIAMLSEEHRTIYPHDKKLLEFADVCFEQLDAEYDDAPEPEGWLMARGLEFNDPNDHKEIYALGNWLFLHSYLLTPAFAVTMQEIIASANPADGDTTKELNRLLEEAMMENTTGPLALFTPEWVYLMLERRLPELPKQSREELEKIHPYYTRFMEYTDGESIKFFKTYEEMNRFFIDALGWADGEEHLAQAKGATDYVLMVTPHKGMLMARDIARCVKAPGNALYDEAYARHHSFDLLVDRGLCPGDLLRRILKEDWLPDASFPAADVDLLDNKTLVKQNSDFIARCYLQIYYRGD